MAGEGLRLMGWLDGATIRPSGEAAFVIEYGEEIDQAVGRRVAASHYQVGMYGFAPGYAYLSGIDQSLTLPRRQKPRPPIPAGSIIIAAGMAVLASVSMPTGWYVVGRTALTLFDSDADPMVPFAVGDRLTFESVSRDELERFAAAGDGGLRRADA